MNWLLLTIAVSVGILNAIGLLIILKRKWKRDSAKCGKHDVIVNVYETLKASADEEVTFHIQMTEFTADMLKLNEWYYAMWSKFLNSIWFDYHENIRKGLPQQETYWFGERLETGSDEDLEQLMKENEIRPKDLK